MNGNKPLLSICIPTRNRQYYCIEAIKHILSYDNQDFELCIHDHSDDRTIEEFVSSIEDKRLKYIYTTEAISSSENMSKSIEMSIGEVVCMIGDDDTVLPSILKWAKYMKEHDIDSICPGYRPEYFWPNEETGNTGTLKIVQYKNMKEIEEVEPMKRLEKLFENGIINYQVYNLPRVYHGLVKKEVIDKIYKKMGTYFAGLSPDIYSTVALSSFVKNHFVIKDACSIAGACPASTTSAGRLNQDDIKFEDAPHFKNNTNYQWDALIPKYYCGEIIWAETAIRATRDFELNKILEKFNRNLFNNASLSHNRHITRIVMKAYFENTNKNNNIINRNVYLINSYIYSIQDFIKRAYHKVFLKSTLIYNELGNIFFASKKCMLDRDKNDK